MQDDENFEEIENRLLESRAVPAPGFRGELRRKLLKRSEATPPRIRVLIGVYAGSGALLLAVAAIGVAGVGPLSA